LVSLASAFEVSPANPSPGEDIIIKGTAAPNEDVRLRSSFQMDLSVSGGRYEYETRVEIPQKPNRFTVTARNVKDLNAGVKMVIWITKRFEASGGVATVSQADVPPGKYSLKMFGEALPGATVVPVNVEAETVVRADSEGKYRLTIDTSGIPAGDYSIKGDGDSKTIRIGSPASAPAAIPADRGKEEEGPNKASASYTTDGPSMIAITPEVIKWYAGEIGLNPKDPAQYAQAEESLKDRVKGDYWRVIARGDPMTEVAGNCEEEYCLVRGIDACTVCREKDILLKSKNSSVKAQQRENNTLPASTIEEETASENKGFIGEVMEWIWG
ncbi:MAG: carboxypeptidase-like regulatory domain-containing protein, partial [Methanotrichaceae archaeon]|nr:carboxypeptidase-like regulatory domain-containing protein [Methanotrichaceae archaeon]